MHGGVNFGVNVGVDLGVNCGVNFGVDFELGATSVSTFLGGQHFSSGKSIQFLGGNGWGATSVSQILS